MHHLGIGPSGARRTLRAGTAAAALAAILSVLLAGPPATHAARCSKTSTGRVPLTDLGAGTYEGYRGGLYPGGVSERPASHEALLEKVGRVVLLDDEGKPDADDGRIVLLSIGMSNTTQEFSVFKRKAQRDPTLNSRVVIVDGAEAGQSAGDISDPNATYWRRVDMKLRSAGVVPEQVQAIWLKEAMREPTEPFPQDAQILRDELRSIVQIIKDRYPNARIVYVSSRIYAGYATGTLNPEPYAYQSGYAVRWLIEEQLDGEPAVNVDPRRGEVRAPWLSWGPYMWADGTAPRGDGLTWSCREFERDGIHPSNSGRDKVADMLLEHFQTDPTAESWFVDCDLADEDTFAAPPPVRGLEVDYADVGVQVSWEDLGPAAGSAVVFDVKSGPLEALRADRGFASAGCLATGLREPRVDDASSEPVSTWYLARGRNSCGSGSWENDGAGPGPRDALDAGVGCP